MSNGEVEGAKFLDALPQHSRGIHCRRSPYQTGI